MHEHVLVGESGCVAQVLVCGLDGKCLTCYRAYSDALGVKSVAWSPSGQLLAVGSYDQVCSWVRPLAVMARLQCTVQ